MNKKIIVLAIAAFTAAFGAYHAIKDLAAAFEDFDFDDEYEDLNDL